MLYLCYLRKGLVYVPVTGEVAGGAGHEIIEPVAVVPVAETEALRRALREAIGRGNPIVPNLPRDQQPAPFLPRYAKVRSWSAFARDTSLWSIKEKAGVYAIMPWPRSGSGWVPDRRQVTELPPGSTVEDVADRMTAILQTAAISPRE